MLEKGRREGGTRKSHKRGVRLGLTGSLASGKSTALKIFRKRGFRVLSSDEVVAEIYAERRITKDEILRRFGLSAAGIKKLEKWIHPLVKRKILAFLSASKTHPSVVEVPLLFEAKFDRLFDHCVCIHAPLEDRRRRAVKRGMSLKVFQALNRRQWSAARKARASDFVLINTSKTI